MLLPDREIIHKLLKGELAPEDAGAVFLPKSDPLPPEAKRAGHDIPR